MKTILVIDDDDAIRQLAAKVLFKRGYDVLQASDGKSGLKVAHQQLPSLVLCDIAMNDVNGYDVLQDLRSHTTTSTIPLIFMTGALENQNMRSGMDLGADDYLPKPFTPQILCDAVQARLERHEMIQQQAKEHEVMLLEILSATQDLVAVTDAGSGRLVYLNLSGRRLLGLGEREDISSLRLDGFQTENCANGSSNGHVPDGKTPNIWRGESIFISRDGRSIPVNKQVLPHLSPNGKVIHFFTVASDITEAKRTEQQVRLQASALAAAANGIVITDRSGRVLWANPAFTRLTGYSAEEAAGETPALLKSGHHAPRFYQNLWNTILSGKVWNGELVNRRKDGSLYQEEMTITPVCNDHGEIQNFIAIKQDISQRKKTEEDLARERDLLRSLMDNLPDHIYFKDIQSRFTRINPAHAQHLGLSHPEEAVGKSDADFFSADAARQKFTDEQRLFATGEPLLGLIEESNTVGKQCWVSSTKVPLRDSEGRIMGLVGISRDITKLKQAEEERQNMEVQLRQAQKLESIGQLAAGIAHEINTPTQYVGDNTRFLKDAFDNIISLLRSHGELLAAAKENALTPEIIEHAEEVLMASDLEYLFNQIPQAIQETLEGVERVTKIVRAMKEFSHPGGKEKAAADINKAIESTSTVARNEWKYVSDLKLDLAPDLPLVPCFLGEFNQVILNLVINAAHAIADVVKQKPETKGLITISTHQDGDHIEVSVSDTGTGIAENHRAHVFEPFFTTKGVGRGTGQGLTMVYSTIVKKHGGTVTFETEIGKGTTFIVRLPIHPPIAKAEKPPTAASEKALPQP